MPITTGGALCDRMGTVVGTRVGEFGVLAGGVVFVPAVGPAISGDDDELPVDGMMAARADERSAKRLPCGGPWDSSLSDMASLL